MFKCLHSVRFDDVDGAGIVYYPRFLHFCHKTFEDAFNLHAPFNYPHLISKMKIGFPTVNIQANFFQPFYYGDQIETLFSVGKIGKSSLLCHYQFFKKDSDVLCFKADITIVCMDLVKKKSLALNDEFRKFFEKFLIKEI